MRLAASVPKVVHCRFIMKCGPASEFFFYGGMRERTFSDRVLGERYAQHLLQHVSRE